MYIAKNPQSSLDEKEFKKVTNGFYFSMLANNASDSASNELEKLLDTPKAEGEKDK